MGEYVKYKGSETKIGTVESIYYVSFEKYQKALNRNQLSKLDGNDFPENYMKPAAFKFRFPFPDEDKLAFGDIIEPFNRGIPVKIDQAAFADPDMQAIQYEIAITQQKLITRQSDGKECLAVVN